MTHLSDLTTAQLKRAVEIREQIEALNLELNNIFGAQKDIQAVEKPRRGRPPGKGRRRMSAAGRAAISAAAKARWAKRKSEGKNSL